MVLYRKEMIVILNQFLSIIFFFNVGWKFIRFIDESKTLNLALFEIYLFNKKFYNKISLYLKFKINFGLWLSNLIECYEIIVLIKLVFGII